MDLYVDSIYEPILTGAQLQAILSSVCNLLYKCTHRRGVCICIYACVYAQTYLNTSPHISYTANFLCLHSLFAYLYTGFHSLYNKNVISSSWCIYFPKVLFLLLF